MLFNISGAVFHQHASKYVDLKEFSVKEKDGTYTTGWYCPECTQHFTKEQIEATAKTPSLKGRKLPAFVPPAE